MENKKQIIWFILLVMFVSLSCNNDEKIVEPVINSPADTEVKLISPENNNICSNTASIFRWNKIKDVAHFAFYLSTDSDFENLVDFEYTADTSIIVPGLEKFKNYFWKVIGYTENKHAISSTVNKVKIVPDYISFLNNCKIDIIVHCVANYREVVKRSPVLEYRDYKINNLSPYCGFDNYRVEGNHLYGEYDNGMTNSIKRTVDIVFDNTYQNIKSIHFKSKYVYSPDTYDTSLWLGNIPIELVQEGRLIYRIGGIQSGYSCGYSFTQTHQFDGIIKTCSSIEWNKDSYIMIEFNK